MSTDPAEVFGLARARVRASFDRASSTCGAAAPLQARAGAELLERLAPFGFAPRRVLDLGAGTGRLTRELKRRYPRAQVVALDLAGAMLHQARRHLRPWRRFARVCADAHRLPLATGSIDLVFSNLMLQWCEPLDAACAEVRRVLAPEGFFAFSTLGPDTLAELRVAWSQADAYNHVNHFPHIQEVGNALLQAGLSEPVLDGERTVTHYGQVVGLMRDLKANGAHNVTAGRPRGLTGRTRLQRVQAAYEQWRTAEGLPATWEIIYGAAWGAAGARGRAALTGGEARITVGSIGRAPRR
ncbi:MAG: malonyl-ACP O-methyltransferase BioC [Proteobacteria bacterium]|nr:malonyl-ACP O-methyltransferase BioC [Pseudomonadota bacterium]